jgi:hypothetical protein
MFLLVVLLFLRPIISVVKNDCFILCRRLGFRLLKQISYGCSTFSYHSLLSLSAIIICVEIFFLLFCISTFFYFCCQHELLKQRKKNAKINQQRS